VRSSRRYPPTKPRRGSLRTSSSTTPASVASAPRIDGLVKDPPDKASDMVTIVAAHLAGCVAETLRKFRRSRKQQQTSRLDGVARHADQTGPLSLFFALMIPVSRPAVDAAVGAMFNFCGRGFDPQVQIPGRFGSRNFRVKRAPLGAHLAALHAKTLLDAVAPPVEGARIDGHVAGVHLLVAELLRSRVHDP